jgi:signal recognition particle receptor subunit alpha
MQQLMVGVYLAEFCLLGLFAINIGSSTVAVGPVVLQVLLIIVTIVVHIAMRKKLAPLVSSLPLNLLQECERRQHDQRASRPEHHDHAAACDSEEMHPGYDAKDEIVTSGPDGSGLVSGAAAQFSSTEYRNRSAKEDIADLAGRPEKRSLLQRVFKPQGQSAADLSAGLNPRFREPVQVYDAQEARKAYLHPAVVAEPPVIWLARDTLGVSAKEVRDLRGKLGNYGVEVTDQGAVCNEKGKIEWAEGSVHEAPLWEKRIVY